MRFGILLIPIQYCNQVENDLILSIVEGVYIEQKTN